MEEEPGCRSRRARPWARSSGRSSPSRWYCSPSSSPLPSCPDQRPAVPAVRSDDLGRDAVLRHQRLDADPRAVRAASEARQTIRGPNALQAAIDLARWLRRGGARLMRVAILGVVVVAGVMAASALFVKTPKGFLPAEDKGTSLSSARCGSGAPRSIGRKPRRSRSTRSCGGPGCREGAFGGRARLPRRRRVVELGHHVRTSQALRGAHRSVAKRRRDHRAPAAAAGGDPGCCRISVQPAADPRMGNTGGFQYVLEALQGQSPTDLAAVLRALLVAANGQPELAGVYSTYAADTPQIYLDIDRDKAQVLGVKISDIFNALQSTLGDVLRQRLQRLWTHVAGQYPGRDSRFARIDDVDRIYVRNAQGGRCRSGRWRKRSWCRGRRR